MGIFTSNLLKIELKHEQSSGPQVVITLENKNLPWIEKLLIVFGYGFIKKERGNISRWVISDYKGLIE